MKKLLLAIAMVALVCVQSQAQHTTPRYPYESHTLTNGAQMITHLNYVTDATGATDTTFITPVHFSEEYIINDGDTLNGTKVIDLATLTRSGVNYSKAGCYKLDRLTIFYKESVIAKTIKLVGAFGVGGATYTITTGTTNGKFVRAEYVFDGANFIVQ